jgi:hypothetical protein
VVFDVHSAAVQEVSLHVVRVVSYTTEEVR